MYSKRENLRTQRRSFICFLKHLRNKQTNLCTKIKIQKTTTKAALGVFLPILVRIRKVEGKRL